MSSPIVECVPNFSEGRDKKKIEQILAAIRGVEGAELVDVDPGFETNRTVVTIVGAPDAVSEAAFRAIAKAADVIDMSQHQGAHPRHGATDVCPFVPVANATMDDCIQLAKGLGERVGRELGIPVFLYDQAAQMPSRRSLAEVRAGEYEALAEKMGKPEWKPDFGPAKFSAKAGVVTIGAREFLIAYNINLNSKTKDHANDLAFELREKGRALRRGQGSPFYTSGKLVKYRPSKNEFPNPHDEHIATSLEELETYYRDSLGLDFHEELASFGRNPAELEGVNVMKPGLFRECRAVGWVIPEYDRAQISINLTNFKITPVHDVFEACSELANARGLKVTGSEVVGVIPYRALRETGEFYLNQQGSSRGLPIHDVLECGVQSLGLREVGEFDLEKSVLGVPKLDGELISMSVREIADEVSRPSPAPGGGSIAALAGALGAALAGMVGNLSFQKKGLEDFRPEMEDVAIAAQQLKEQLLGLVDEDTAAFNSVLTAMRMSKDSKAEKAARLGAIEMGYKHATSVPHRTAELCLEAMRICKAVAANGLKASITDAAVGALMARAGVHGAVMNVEINLGEIKDQAWIDNMRSQLGNLGSEADRLESETRDLVAKILS
ncbi:MAG: glutamate formimidoyltransferase [Planctomycetota bacterium]